MMTKEFKHEVKAYTAPQSTVIALVAKQTLLADSGPEEAGSPGEDDPYFNDYGTI
ncbi:MAG: hypothetical protein ACI3Y4_04795 [Candidatus Cryptobacteroides sp.]